MTTAETESTTDLAALQQLPETDAADTEEDTPTCATTGLYPPVPADTVSTDESERAGG